MKRKKKNKLILIIGAIVLAILLLIVLLVINVVKDKKTSVKNMQIIKDSYNELSVDVTEYNQIRTDLSEKSNNFVYENYKKEHDEYIKLLNKYNNNIKKIDKNINNINARCNVIYNEITVNKICDSYKTLYEKLINLYVLDLTNYNNKITSYNEYKNENISLFEMIHKEYIDYNKDGIYEGTNHEKNKEEE